MQMYTPCRGLSPVYTSGALSRVSHSKSAHHREAYGQPRRGTLGTLHRYYVLLLPQEEVPADTRRPLRARCTEDVKDSKDEQAETRRPRVEEQILSLPSPAPFICLV